MKQVDRLSGSPDQFDCAGTVKFEGLRIIVSVVPSVLQGGERRAYQAL